MPRIGDTVRPELGRTDFTPFLQGALTGGAAQAQGVANLGQGAANFLQDVKAAKKDREGTIGLLESVKRFVDDPAQIQAIEGLQVQIESAPLDESAALARQAKSMLHFMGQQMDRDLAERVFLSERSNKEAELEAKRAAESAAEFYRRAGLELDLSKEKRDQLEFLNKFGRPAPKFGPQGVASAPSGFAPPSLPQAVPGGDASQMGALPSEPMGGGGVLPQKQIPAEDGLAPDPDASYFPPPPQDGPVDLGDGVTYNQGQVIYESKGAEAQDVAARGVHEDKKIATEGWRGELIRLKKIRQLIEEQGEAYREGVKKPGFLSLVGPEMLEPFPLWGDAMARKARTPREQVINDASVDYAQRLARMNNPKGVVTDKDFKQAQGALFAEGKATDANIEALDQFADRMAREGIINEMKDEYIAKYRSLAGFDPDMREVEKRAKAAQREVEALRKDQEKARERELQERVRGDFEFLKGIIEKGEETRSETHSDELKRDLEKATGTPAGQPTSFNVMPKSRDEIPGFVSKPGQRFVALDFNDAPRKSARGIEIVLPYGATDQEKKAAETWAARTRLFFLKHGVDVPIRRNNGIKIGGGKRGVIHTEPFFASDREARSVIEKHPDEYAKILQDTLGTIPGVNFIAPHTRKDTGAVSDGISEREFALNVILPQLARTS